LAAGVPEIVAVPLLLSWNDTLLGNLPFLAIDGKGVPTVVTVKEKFDPAEAVTLLTLVMALPANPVKVWMPANESDIEPPSPGLKPVTVPGEVDESPFTEMLVPDGALLRSRVLSDPWPVKVKPPPLPARKVVDPAEEPTTVEMSEKTSVPPEDRPLTVPATTEMLVPAGALLRSRVLPDPWPAIGPMRRQSTGRRSPRAACYGAEIH